MENKEQQYKNLTLISINNTLHIKADNLEPVEVDSSCDSELKQLIGKAYLKAGGWLRCGLTLEEFKKDGVKIPKRMADRIQIVRDVNCPVGSPKAFLIPEKEEKGIKITDIEIPKSKGLKPKTEWCVTKEQMLEELTSMQKKLDESYTIEEIKETLRKYIKHVDDCEGSNFISRLNTSESDVKFSELEVKLLEELSNY